MMQSDWGPKILGDVVSLQRGHDLPEPQRRPGQIPILGSFGVTGWHDEAKCRGPGVTVGRSGASFGVVSFTFDDYWPLNTVLYATNFHGNDERFVHYLLKTIDFSGYNTGSAQPSLNRNHVRNISVIVPGPNEQRAIAGVLGALDEKIEQNRRTLAALERFARAIFRAWFVDFEPVKAKATGAICFPSMPQDIFDALPTRLVDSELGPVPEGWEIGKLGEIVRSTHTAFVRARSTATLAPLQQKLLCRMRSCWPDDFNPCSGEEFQPIVSGLLKWTPPVTQVHGGYSF